jgi:hypothetical protein
VSKIGPVGMKDWNDEQQRWIGTIVEADEEACQITVLDVGSAAAQVEIDDWIQRAGPQGKEVERVTRSRPGHRIEDDTPRPVSAHRRPPTGRQGASQRANHLPAPHTSLRPLRAACSR